MITPVCSVVKRRTSFLEDKILFLLTTLGLFFGLSAQGTFFDSMLIKSLNL